MNKTEYKVFLSYSHKDQEIANSLTKAFDQYKISYQADQQLRAGENWMEEIERALQEASVFVLLLSPDFVSSDWAMFEIGHAISRHKKDKAAIIPVIIRDSIVPDVLRSYLWLDARLMKPESIAQELKKIIKVKVDSVANDSDTKRSDRSMKVFFSYSSLDTTIASSIADALRQKNLDVFPFQNDLRATHEWPFKEEKYLQTCDGILLLWSEHCDTPSWVESERTYKRQQLKTIIVVRLDDTPIPSLLKNYSVIYHSDLSVIVQEILQGFKVEDVNQ